MISAQKLPTVVADEREKPRTSAKAMARPVAAERKLCTVRPSIWVEMAHRRLAGVILPVGVGDEADRGVEGEIGRHGVEAVRVERQQALQPLHR